MGSDRSRSRDRRSRDRRDRRDRSRDRGGDRDRGDRGDRGERGPSKVESRPDDDTFKPGRTVVVKGLQKNPEKNGSIGKLMEFNTEKSRWAVELTGGTNNFKEENLDLMPDNSDVIKDDEEPPTAKIYITGLTSDTTQQDLINLFKGCGMIAKEKPKGRDPGYEDQWPFAVKLYRPGRNDGDAQIAYMDPYAAKAAIKTYNRFKFKGTKIAVQYAGQGRKYDPVELKLPWHMRQENQGKLDRDGGGAGPEGRSGTKPGDWTCPECGAENFASRDSCFKCNAAKPGDMGGGGGGGDERRAAEDRRGGAGRGFERNDGGSKGGKDGGYDRGGGKGGKDGGGKGGKGGKDEGKGGARPGDWTCEQCGASVFASKDTCFKCGAAKPRGAGGSKGGGRW